ncbi:hypothetical protein [Rhodopirellula sp. SWK7]|uniref:hypothetical protein n=1 Tax=Rhodopirellula sp. SWK7 TaxID=595460 RepID=UPI00191BFF84|nr:hypothetical protein [Rhodopirellula sp. SWK7]
MARELGLSPKKFGSYANRDKQPWKLPLVEFIEFLYERQFGVKEPEHVQTMEEIAAAHVAKRAERKIKKMSGESGDDLSETSDSDENTDDASDASPENVETSAVDNESTEKDA